MSVYKNVVDLLKEEKIFLLSEDVDSYNPNIAYLAETKAQARSIIWPDLCRFLNDIPGVRMNSQLLTMTIPRPNTQDTITIHLKASKYHNSIRGMKFRYMYLDEGQLLSEEAFTKSIFATLASCKGELTVTGTAIPKGFFKDLVKRGIEEGFAWIFPADKTNVFSQSYLDTLRQQMGETAYKQEMLVDFDVPLKGSFYSEELQRLEDTGEIYINEEAGPNIPLQLGVDVGVGDGFACWAIKITKEGQIELKDFYTGYEVLHDLRDDIHADLKTHPSTIFVPFDSTARRLEAFRGRRVIDVFMEVFPEAEIIPVERPKSTMSEIAVVRQHLHLVKIFSRNTSVDLHNGIFLLKNYRRQLDKDGHYTDRIDKSNRADHCADALRTLMMGLNVVKGIATHISGYDYTQPKEYVDRYAHRYLRNTYKGNVDMVGRPIRNRKKGKDYRKILTGDKL